MIGGMRPIRRSDRTKKVQRIAQGLGAIGELFQRKREQEAKRRQQELENRMEQAKLDLLNEKNKVDAGNLDARNREIDLDEKQRQDRIDKALRETQAEADLQTLTEEGLIVRYEEAWGKPPDEKAMTVIRAAAAADPTRAKPLLEGLFSKATAPGSSDNSAVSERERQAIYDSILTPDPSQSLLSYVTSDVTNTEVRRFAPDIKTTSNQSFGEQALNFALDAGSTPGTNEFNHRVFQFVEDNMGDAGSIKGLPKEPGFQQDLARQTADYLIQNMDFFLGKLQGSVQGAPAQGQAEPTTTEEDPIARLERILNQ